MRARWTATAPHSSARVSGWPVAAGASRRGPAPDGRAGAPPDNAPAAPFRGPHRPRLGRAQTAGGLPAPCAVGDGAVRRAATGVDEDTPGLGSAATRMLGAAM